MSKKKREHIVFDQDRKEKKSVPFARVNQQAPTGKKKQVKKP